MDILRDEGESITNGVSGAPVMSQLLGAAEKPLPENITQNRYPPYLGSKPISTYVESAAMSNQLTMATIDLGGKELGNVCNVGNGESRYVTTSVYRRP